MRAIVSTPDTRGGQWRLDGTRMPVCSIRAWADDGLDKINRQYPGLDLTADELAACLAWTFPAIHDEPRMPIEYELLECVCGETASSDDECVTWRCGWCGRRYRITVTVLVE